MDPFLAEYYGTGQAGEAGYDDDALEKMAQLTLLSKEAAQEGIDLSQLTEQELYQLADEVYGDQAQQAQQEPMEKEASDMFETMDFSGRIMAHALWNELDAIQKEAASAKGAWEGIKGGLRKAHEKTLGRVGAAAEKATMGKMHERIAKQGPEAYDQRLLKEVKRMAPGTKEPATILKNLSPSQLSKVHEGAGGARVGRAANIAAQAATGIGAAGALGGAGYGGYKGVQALRGKDKKSSDSAFEQLVEERALDHLAAAGYVDDYGNVYEPEYEKTASDFDSIVDSAALNYLSSLGYPVE